VGLGSVLSDRSNYLIKMEDTPIKRPTEDISSDHAALRIKQQANSSAYNTPMNFSFSHSKSNSFIPSSPITAKSMSTLRSSPNRDLLGSKDFYCFSEGKLGVIRIAVKSAFIEL
jgi:hypothetical protein